MKINENYVLRQIADTWVVLPLGDATLDFNGMITLNETGSYLWSFLEKGCEVRDLVDALLSEYDVTREAAEADVEAFLNKLRNIDCLEEI
ncbi:MAG: PqqD family protein [Clostridia bacterium]|nr:PqqD family protein [Clostridia bacterium]